MGMVVAAPLERHKECGTCALSAECFAGSLEGDSLRDLEGALQQSVPVHAGNTIFHQGEAFKDVAVVRSGTVKTFAFDREGREHMIGFHMPGDFIGLSAIDEQRHPCSAVALDTVTLCRLPFRVIAELAGKAPLLQAKLFRLMSRDIARVTRLTCNTTAEERLAAFLIGMADRMAARGYSSSRWQLTMSRTDLASFLRLAPETLSRLFRRFQSEGLVAVEGRDVEVRARERLQVMACTQPSPDESSAQARKEAA